MPTNSYEPRPDSRFQGPVLFEHVPVAAKVTHNMERNHGFAGFTCDCGCIITAVAAVGALRFRSMYHDPYRPERERPCRIESARERCLYVVTLTRQKIEDFVLTTPSERSGEHETVRLHIPSTWTAQVSATPERGDG